MQFVNYLPMEQAFANAARERLSSALKYRYGPKSLKGWHLCKLGLIHVAKPL